MSHRLPHRPAATAALLSASLTLGACATTMPHSPGVDPASAFRDCRADALRMDASAGAGGGEAQYLQAARLGHGCLEAADPDFHGFEADAMRLHLLVVLDYLRAGEVALARDALHAFPGRFPARDVYLADRSSLRQTLDALLADAPPAVTANVNPSVRAELRRLHRWADD
jgi:hypothetical protein